MWEQEILPNSDRNSRCTFSDRVERCLLLIHFKKQEAEKPSKQEHVWPEDVRPNKQKTELRLKGCVTEHAN